MSTRSSAPSRAQPAQIAALWFGVQLIWGAVLGISLQARCLQLAPNSALATFGFITTAGALAAAITQLIVGPLSDRLRRAGYGRNGFYLAGTLLGAAAVIVFYVVPNVGALLAAFIALQLALNVIIGPYQAIVPDTMSPARYGLASGWLAALAGAGNAAGAVLAAGLGAVPSLGVVLATGLLIAAAITLTHLRRIALRSLPAAAPIAVTRTLVNLFISRAFVFVGFYTMLDYLYFYVASVLPPDFALDATRASGLCILIFTVVSALGAAFAARPADRIDERLVVTAGGACIIVGLVVLAVGHALPVLPAAIALAGIGWGIFLCADWAFACRLLPPSAMATTMAIWNLAVVVPQMLAPLAASLLLARLGTLASPAGPREAFLLAGGEMLLGTFWIWRLPRVRRGE
ncbi:MAG TPA: MFS transporter [Candidatus Acidoferrum sp.]|nr:MFS transporter [Candidatus Acidoferrum sp.]